MKRVFGLCLIACLALALAGISPATSGADQMTFYVIAHTGPGDPFWAVVQRGVQDAGKALGVKAIFQGPAGYNVPEQVNMFNAAMAAKADGIATSISDARAWADPIREARKRGIPVVAINCQEPEEFRGTIPYMSYIGMDEYEAGKTVARRMLPKLKQGAKVVVAIHQAGHVGLRPGRRGSESDSQGSGRQDRQARHNPRRHAGHWDPQEPQGQSDTAAIFTVGPLGAIPTIKMVRDDGLKGKVLMAVRPRTSHHPGHQRRDLRGRHGPAAVSPGVCGRSRALSECRSSSTRPTTIPDAVS